MQQINLYQPMFRQQKKVFSALTMLQVLGFFTVVLGGIYGYTISSLEPFRQELKKTTVEFERLAGQIETLRGKTPQQAQANLLEAEIARLTQNLDYRRKLKEALEAGSFGNTEGFSSYFEALATGHVDGAWLTNIQIAQGGKQLNLAGKTVDPELVPVYMKRLSESPIFSRRGFNVLELARSEKEAAVVSFNIATGG